MSHGISLQTISHELKFFIRSRSIKFLKESFLISFIFASLLYILMRVFFIGSEFSLVESIGLYFKTVLVTWSYINAWKLICMIVVWIDVKTSKQSFKGVFSMQALKRVAVLILVAGIAYKVKASPKKVIKTKVTSEKQESKNLEIGSPLFFWIK